jgi:hypothetical protein
MRKVVGHLRVHVKIKFEIKVNYRSLLRSLFKNVFCAIWVNLLHFSFFAENSFCPKLLGAG